MRALEKEMATHSSTLAWRIPGMEEPGGLPSMASQSCRPLKWLSSGSKHYVSRVLRWKHQPGGLRYWDLQSNTLESTPSPTSCRPGMVAGQIPSMLYTSLKWEPPAIIQILVNTKECMCNSDLQTKYLEYTLTINLDGPSLSCLFPWRRRSRDSGRTSPARWAGAERRWRWAVRKMEPWRRWYPQRSHTGGMSRGPGRARQSFSGKEAAGKRRGTRNPDSPLGHFPPSPASLHVPAPTSAHHLQQAMLTGWLFGNEVRDPKSSVHIASVTCTSGAVHACYVASVTSNTLQLQGR